MTRTEQKSGYSLKDRGGMSTILDFLREGETLIVADVDRLARSMRGLQFNADCLKQKGTHLAAKQLVDTAAAAGKAFFDMTGVFAEFETNLRGERQAEGIANAKVKDGQKQLRQVGHLGIRRLTLQMI